MRLATVLGSPRKRGNTAAVLEQFENLVRGQHEVDRINVTDYEIRGCLGCDRCKRVHDRPGCVQVDAAVGVLERIMGADAVVYATPLYVWSFSAQLKALMDRHYCLVKAIGEGGRRSLVEGKRAALLVTCAGPREGNADLIQEIFRREMSYGRCRVVGIYIVPDCTSPQALGARAFDVAKRMATDVVQSEGRVW
jgi:multimeric flavodoxin WrbA